MNSLSFLTIDGGGTRGYVALLFLERFLDYFPKQKITRVFNCFAGTSIGSTISAGLIYGVSIDELKKFFREKAPWIFTIRTTAETLVGSSSASEPSNRPNYAQKLGMLATDDPFYKATSEESNYGDVRLKKELKEIFGNKKMSYLTKPFFCPSFNQTKKQTIVFSNLNTSNTIGQDLPIVDCLMASMSAPVYFPPYEIQLNRDTEVEPDKFVDGGVFSNNPSNLAISFSSLIAPYADKTFLLSLGTGATKNTLDGTQTEKQDNPSTISTFLNLYDTVMQNASLENHFTLKVLSENNILNNFFYHRFNIKFADDENSELDNSTSDFFDFLEQKVTERYNQKQTEIGNFASKLADELGM